MNNNFKKAFTLAEVLITLGIIGVVAAMTVPTIVSGYQKQVYTSQLKKVYSEMSAIFPRYLSDQRVESMKETDFVRKADSVGVDEFLDGGYLKIKKSSEKLVKDCFAESYMAIGDGEIHTTSDTGKCDGVGTTASGAALCFDKYTDRDYVVSIEVDVNGKDAPNVFGRDRFIMYVKDNGDIYDAVWENSKVLNLNVSNGSATGAFGYLMDNGWKMDY